MCRIKIRVLTLSNNKDDIIEHALNRLIKTGGVKITDGKNHQRLYDITDDIDVDVII